jgi:hypothetical protein
MSRVNRTALRLSANGIGASSKAVDITSRNSASRSLLFGDTICWVYIIASLLLIICPFSYNQKGMM